jgi:hypothetical protein
VDNIPKSTYGSSIERVGKQTENEIDNERVRKVSGDSEKFSFPEHTHCSTTSYIPGFEAPLKDIK